MTQNKARTSGMAEGTGRPVNQMYRGFGGGIIIVENGPGLGRRGGEEQPTKAASAPKKKLNYQDQHRLNKELLAACRNDELESARKALDEGADVNATDITNGTPLMRASARGHIEVVRLLLERDADRDMKDNEGRTALMLADAHRHSDITELLRNRKAV